MGKFTVQMQSCLSLPASHNPTPSLPAKSSMTQLGLQHSLQEVFFLLDTLFSLQSKVSVEGPVLPGLLLTGWI